MVRTQDHVQIKSVSNETLSTLFLVPFFLPFSLQSFMNSMLNKYNGIADIPAPFLVVVYFLPFFYLSLVRIRRAVGFLISFILAFFSFKFFFFSRLVVFNEFFWHMNEYKIKSFVRIIFGTFYTSLKFWQILCFHQRHA